jgi:hypothetical protein
VFSEKNRLIFYQTAYFKKLVTNFYLMKRYLCSCVLQISHISQVQFDSLYQFDKKTLRRFDPEEPSSENETIDSSLKTLNPVLIESSLP